MFWPKTDCFDRTGVHRGLNPEPGTSRCYVSDLSLKINLIVVYGPIPGDRGVKTLTGDVPVSFIFSDDLTMCYVITT